MARAFTEREKEIIRQRLFEKGEELISVYGIRKTGIEDLSKAVGISKGAFYSFFNSKEELFLEVIERFEQKFYEGLFEESFQSNENPREDFKRFLNKSISLVETNPIIKKLSSDELEHFIRNLPEDKIKDHAHRDFELILNFVEQQKKRDYIKDYDSKAIAGVIRSIIFLSLHREEFVQESYPQMMEMLVDMAANYLIIE